MSTPRCWRFWRVVAVVAWYHGLDAAQTALFQRLQAQP